MTLNERICPICGSSQLVKKDGEWYCKSCDTFLFDKVESDEQKITFISRKSDAESDLKLNPPRFNDAEEKFDRLIKEFSNSSSLYWGKLRAKYGIKYEIDHDGKSVPSCYKAKYVDFRKDKLFLKAIELAENLTLKNKYISEAERIAVTWQEWETKAKKFDYDIFLSFKASENGNETEDNKLMRELYSFLAEKGLKVFYSPVTMREFVGKPYYDAYIFNALEKASALIVCGLKPEYFSTSWVENEWSRYLSQIQRGEKEKDSLIILYGNFNPTEELPRQIAYRQGISATSRTLFPDICNIVEDILVKSRRKNALEHISVEKNEQGIKKTAEKAILELEDAGTSIVRKKEFSKPREVEFKELSNSATGIYTPDINDKLDAAALLLKTGNFDDAMTFYNDCITEDNANGKAWIGIFATKLFDYQVLNDFNKGIPFKKRVLDFEECCIIEELFVEIQNVLEYADDKETGERILLFLSESVLPSLFAHSDAKKNFCYFAEQIFNIVISYNTNHRVSSRRIILNNLDKIYKLTDYDLFEKISNEMLDSIVGNDLEEYLNIIESVIQVLDKNKNLSKAILWNDLKLKHYEGDVKSVIRSLYYSCSVNSKKDFILYNKNNLAAKNIIEIVNYRIDKISKDDIPILFKLLQETELECVKNDYNLDYSLSNAKMYFDFLTKFKFSERMDFIVAHRKYSSNFAKGDKLDFELDFIEKLNFGDDPDAYIDELNNFGKQLLMYNHFDTAINCFNRVFSYQENNFIALKNILFATIKFNLEDYKDADVSSLTIEEFEKVLSFAPSNDDQQEVIKTLLKICFEQIIKEDTTSNEVDSIVEKFNFIIKYYNFTQNKQVSIINKMAKLCLSKGLFDNAINYANISLQNESRTNIDARSVSLFASLKCKNKDDFIKCSDFNKNLQEYKDLLLACSNDEQKLNSFIALAEENIKTVEQIFIDEKNAQNNRIKAEKAEKERKEKEILALIQIEAKQARIKRLEFYQILLIILVFALTIGFTIFFAVKEGMAMGNIYDYCNTFSYCNFGFSIGIGIALSVAVLVCIIKKEAKSFFLAAAIQLGNFVLSCIRAGIFVTRDGYKWPLMWPHLMLAGTLGLDILLFIAIVAIEDKKEFLFMEMER